jgi:hypothetical protein
MLTVRDGGKNATGKYGNEVKRERGERRKGRGRGR